MADRERLIVKDLYAEKFTLLRPVWDDYVQSLAIAGRPGNSDPSWTQIGTSGIYQPGFVATQDDEVQFTLQTPHSAAIGAKFSDVYAAALSNEIECHIHWVPSTTDTGNCVWELTYWASKRGTAYASGDVVTKTVTVAASGVVAEQITELCTINSSVFVDSTVIPCRLRRLGTALGDTFTGIAIGLSLDFHILRNSLGSQSQYGDA